MAEKRKISLVLADVDGTLVTEEKILTEWARKAVSALQETGIRFAITSGRPPLGMAMLFDVLDIETPIADSQAAFGQHATANGSQPYYLDVTNKDANKGAVVEYLSRHLGLPAQEIATIGDQSNDVLMFKRSRFSIAMGNASDQVNTQAAAVTDSYNEEGFAKAMEAFILGSAR
jgi:hydroxymethylpyrimidine pyrophosphatase-like HAD family hydrolase